MRIIGGKHRGRRLAEFAGEEIRPTSDRAKEALFNILAPVICGAQMLDLFCGSGSIGLEGISRGAGAVHFNDLSEDSLAVLKKNIAAVGEEQLCTITCSDYLHCLNSLNKSFDIIYIDPPYRFDYGERALEVISRRHLLSEGGVAVYERDRSFLGEVDGLEKYDERKYGKAYLTFFKYKR